MVQSISMDGSEVSGVNVGTGSFSIDLHGSNSQKYIQLQQQIGMLDNMKVAAQMRIEQQSSGISKVTFYNLRPYRALTERAASVVRGLGGVELIGSVVFILLGVIVMVIWQSSVGEGIGGTLGGTGVGLGYSRIKSCLVDGAKTTPERAEMPPAVKSLFDGRPSGDVSTTSSQSASSSSSSSPSALPNSTGIQFSLGSPAGGDAGGFSLSLNPSGGNGITFSLNTPSTAPLSRSPSSAVMPFASDQTIDRGLQLTLPLPPPMRSISPAPTPRLGTVFSDEAPARTQFEPSSLSSMSSRSLSPSLPLPPPPPADPSSEEDQLVRQFSALSLRSQPQVTQTDSAVSLDMTSQSQI